MLLNCGVAEDCWESTRRSNQSILKEISPKYSLEGLMLKLQYFGHLIQRTDSLEKTLMVGKTEGRSRGWQRMWWLDGITRLNGHESEQAQGVGDGQGSLACCSPWGHKELDMTKGLKWTELNWWNISLHSIGPCFYHQSHPQLGIVFALAPSLFSGVTSPLISSSILGTYWPGEFLFQYPIILPFHTVHGVLKARILKWFAIPFSSGPHSVRPLHQDPPVLGCSTGMA